MAYNKLLIQLPSQYGHCTLWYAYFLDLLLGKDWIEVTQWEEDVKYPLGK